MDRSSSPYFPIRIDCIRRSTRMPGQVFGQGRYLLSDRVAITGGLRYSHEREEAHVIAEGLRSFDVISTADDAAWTPKAGIELETSRDTFLFLSATRGFKSGGVNIVAQVPGSTFRPELAWSYEAGVKRTLPGGRGRVNAAVFYVDYRDLQVAVDSRSWRDRCQQRTSHEQRAGGGGDCVGGRRTPVPGHLVLARCRLRAVHFRRGGRNRQPAERRPRMVREWLRDLRVSARRHRKCPSAATSPGRAACSFRRSMTPSSPNLHMHWFMHAPRSCRAAAAGKRQCTYATLAVRSP